MARFRYAALDARGERLGGWLEAVDAAEVASRLQAQGHIPLQAVPARTGEAGAGWTGRLRRPGLSSRQVLQFTQQLATLLSAGQPLDRALDVLAGLQAGAAGRKLVEGLRDRVRGGQPFSAALQEEAGVFSRLHVSLVRAGEAGGTLPDSLQRLASHLERIAALRGDLVNALIYPAFLVTGVFASTGLLLVWVVPQFVPIFADMGVPVPWVTRLILGTGAILRQAGWPLLAMLAAMAVWMRRGDREGRRHRRHARLLTLPGVGPLCLKLETARLCRCLGTLLQQGVALLAALQIAAGVSANRAVGGGLQQVGQAVSDGIGLHVALGRIRLFPALALQMIRVGEESGRLDGMLLKVADTYDEEVRRGIDRLLSALVPGLTLVMTLLVALVMAAILLPLLSLTSHIQ